MTQCKQSAPINHYKLTGLIFNNDFLFLHVPKTGGIALSSELLQKLKPPIYYTLPSGHQSVKIPGVMYLNGKRHENLNQAMKFFDNHKRVLARKLDDYKTILIVIRNPYEIVVSRYHYLLLNNPWDKGPAKDIALTSSFEEFAINAPHYFNLKKYIIHNNVIPKNLHIIRYNDLKTQINRKISTHLKSKISLSERKNATTHNHWQEYITTEAIEHNIYQKFKFAFDKGFYSRYNV